jgi:geranylgeranyl diphosphate synthase type II
MMLSDTSMHFQFEIKTYLEDRRELVEAELERQLPMKEPGLLFESMRYSLLAGGKRMRALLAIAAYETISRRQQAAPPDGLAEVLPLACAIEMVHAMSLIHDDLPALDNDDVRRGKPTNHKVFGEAMALLAGDALLMSAMETLICSRDIEDPSLKTELKRRRRKPTERILPSRSRRESILLDIALRLARATGAEGMVGGQVFDLIYTGKGDLAPIDENVLARIHKGKTGALIKFSLWSGARLAGASPSELAVMDELGEIMGLAFQIKDDLLDVTGDVKTLGKTPGKDEAANKATWVSVFGVDGARAELADLEARGKALIEKSGLGDSDWPILPALLKMAIYRSQ